MAIAMRAADHSVMKQILEHRLSRRRFLQLGGLAAVALTGCASRLHGPGVRTREYRLAMIPARVPLVGEPYPDTDVWSYGGRVPGPELRVRQGERLRVTVENHLAQETTVHWHGLRVPNAMDGVPHLTQHPIPPGGTYVYEFDVPDAGTYWYHPHQRSFEQVGRGLYGALVIEERDAPGVDRDVTWVLGDFRLTREAMITEDFANLRDMTHAGRIGNTVTVNGRRRPSFRVRAGERVRLRLINAANARIFGLEFEGHRPLVIALDGQPVEPHAPHDGRLVLGPGMRADVLLDMVAAPGHRAAVTDRFYPRFAYTLLDIAYDDAPPLRSAFDAPAWRLPPNSQPEPALADAQRHVIELDGGMMGGMRGAMVNGRWTDVRSMIHQGMMWSINGVAASGHVLEPMLVLRRDRSYVLTLANRSAWPHPMHLHGHVFRVIRRNGEATQYREWQDTVLLGPRESAEIAFVTDNPGDWMFHCHILEHQAGGMMGVIRVA